MGFHGDVKPKPDLIPGGFQKAKKKGICVDLRHRVVVELHHGAVEAVFACAFRAGCLEHRMCRSKNYLPTARLLPSPACVSRGAVARFMKAAIVLLLSGRALAVAISLGKALIASRNPLLVIATAPSGDLEMSEPSRTAGS